MLAMTNPFSASHSSGIADDGGYSGKNNWVSAVLVEKIPGIGSETAMLDQKRMVQSKNHFNADDCVICGNHIEIVRMRQRFTSFLVQGSGAGVDLGAIVTQSVIKLWIWIVGRNRGPAGSTRRGPFKVSTLVAARSFG